VGQRGKGVEADEDAFPKGVLILKYVTLSLLLLNIMAIAWLKADLDSSNKLFGLLGLTQNLEQKYMSATQVHEDLFHENLRHTKTIGRLGKQLKTGDFSENFTQIRNLQAQQLTWFEEGEFQSDDFVHGILDSVKRIEEYFNSKNYYHSILTGGNYVKISDISANRRELSFSVDTSNLFGKIFFLSSEFIDVVNTFPFFKDGGITSFSRQKSKEGDDSMSFSLNLVMQGAEEVDLADVKFEDYENWRKGLSQAVNTGPKPKPRVTPASNLIESSKIGESIETVIEEKNFNLKDIDPNEVFKSTTGIRLDSQTEVILNDPNSEF
jgi:hypothetical protein